MDDLRFEWDPAKAKRNLQAHGVSFEEAETAFSDEQAIVLPDPDHSSEEDRFLLLGFSIGFRVLVVVHCYREDDTVIRIISAGRPLRLSVPSMARGGSDEERVRFFEGAAESVRQAA